MRWGGHPQQSELIHTLLPESIGDVCEVCRKDGGNQGQINSYNPNMKKALESIVHAEFAPAGMSFPFYLL